jgi:Zn-dependent protease/CBS domain-containing protein
VKNSDEQSGIMLAQIRGIPLRLHWSVFAVFGLIAYSLARNEFSSRIRPGEPDYAWLLGLVAAALFLVSIVLHELGHAIVAQRNKMKVNSITLFFFGGVAQVEEEPRTAGVEFRVAAAGPIVTALLAAGFFALSRYEALGDLISSGFYWLAGINLALLIFNLIPGFPLDGGRILRSILWQTTGNEAKATKIAVWGGQAVSILLVGYAVYVVVSGGSIINGVWTVMLAMFLRNAATATGAHVMTRSILERVTAGQTMARDLVYVTARTRIQELFDRQQVIDPRQAFVVVDDGPLGVVSPLQLAFVPRERWPWTVVSQIMTPWRQVVEITPDTSLMAALKEMETYGTHYAVVRSPNGNVEGILSRDQIAIKLQATAQSG